MIDTGIVIYARVGIYVCKIKSFSPTWLRFYFPSFESQVA